MMPMTPLHYLMAIPPISLTIKKLTSTFTLHIQKLPPFSLIRTLTSVNPSTDWHLSCNPPTTLTHILPHTFPPFFFPSHPSTPSWSHPQVCDNTVIKINRNTRDATKTIISTPPYDTFHIFIHILTSTPSLFTGSFLLFKGQTLLRSGTTCSHSLPLVLFAALLEGLTYDFFSNHIRIFLLDLSLSNSLFRTSKHTLLPSSRALLSLLSGFLDSHDTHHVDFFRYSIKWSGLPGMAVLDHLREGAQHMIFPLPPTPLLNPKACLLCNLQSQYMDTIQDARIWQSIILPDRCPPPFYIGALSCMDCGTSSTSIQLASGHTFTADYSGLFRKGADDNTLCPCNFTNEARDLDPASPVQSFDDLMWQHLAPATPSPTPPPSP